MLNFNGRLVIKTCETTAVGQWSIAAVFSDNTGMFTARDAGVGDRVYVRGTSVAGAEALCAYRVTHITTAATTAAQLVCTIRFDEGFEDAAQVYTPNVDEDGMICAVSSDAGFAMIPSDASGLPQSLLDQARNISLNQRDHAYAEQVAAQIAAGGGGGNLHGGQLDGSLTASGTVAAVGGLAVVTSTGQTLTSVSSDAAQVGLKGAAPALRVNVDAQEDASTSTTIVAVGDVDASRTVNALGTATESTSTTGVNGATVTHEVGSRGAASVTTTVAGATASSTLTVSGTTSAEMLISVTTTDENGEAGITVDTPSVRVEGQLSAKDLVADGMVAAAKFIQTGVQEDEPEDNQLPTAKYVRDYVAANAFNDELGDQLTAQMSGKADLDQVYTKTELDERLAALGLGDLVDDADHRVVTDEQVTIWDGKQDALGYTPEDTANKGVANGYAGLDEDGHVVAAQMNDDHVNAVITERLANATTADIAPTAERTYASEEQVAMWTAKQDALGYTAEDAANKGVANGYAGLDEDGHVVAAQMNDAHVNTLIDTALGLLTTDDVITTPTNRFVTDEQVTAWTAKQDALGYTAENTNLKGQPNGYAALNSSGQLMADQVNTFQVNMLIDSAFAGKSTNDLSDAAGRRYVTEEQVATWNDKQDALGYTPEDAAKKGQQDGYASLDENGFVPVEQLDFNTYGTVKIAPDDQPVNVSAGTRLIIMGHVADGTTWGGARFMTVKDGNAHELGEFDPTAKTRIPWSLLSRVPEILTNVVDAGEVRAEHMQRAFTNEPGWYSMVNVNEAGLVVGADNPSDSWLRSTHEASFVIGKDEFNSTDYVYLYADAGLENNPFIRYSLNDRRWEYSNNGHTVYSIGESEALFEDVMDSGFVTEPVEDDDSIWTGEIDLGLVTEAHNDQLTIDFNGDAFFDISRIDRLDADDSE